jgi:peroxiredoxin/uncharacterized membrane protein YphA (DoxX/SURF4 family)
MELTLLVARLLLAAVFLLAGAAKLGDRAGASKAVGDFGLPRSLARPLSLLLSAAEILIAVALIVAPLAWYGAGAALALLAIFILGIGANLARGRKPDCHCFGQLHSAPVGWTTLARNGLLAAAAGWLVCRGPSQMGPGVWKHLALAGGNERRLFLLGACVVCFLLFRAVHPSEPAEPASVPLEPESADNRPDGDDVQQTENPAPREIVPLPIGSPAPEFALPGITGEKRSLKALVEQGKAVLLVFSSPYCDPCRALAPNIGHWMRERQDSLNIVVLSRGGVKDNLTKLKELEVSRVLLQPDFEVSEAYGCSATPAAVLVGADGLIQSDLVVGGEAIKELIAST